MLVQLTACVMHDIGLSDMVGTLPGRCCDPEQCPVLCRELASSVVLLAYSAMVSPRVGSTSLPVDPSLYAILADIDSLRSRVISYTHVDQERRRHTQQLETELATIRQELAEFRRENARLKEMDARAANVPPVPSTSSQRQARGGQNDPEVLRRQLRHSHRFDADMDPLSPTQSSVMADSPPSHHAPDSRFQSMETDDTNASMPYMRTEATPQASRTARNTPFETNAASPSRPPRARRAYVSQAVDEPEQASPAHRTPKMKKTQSLGASQMYPNSDRLEELDMPYLSSSAPPQVDREKRNRLPQMEVPSQGDMGKPPSENKRGRSTTSQPVTVQSPGDPYDTDVTYNGPEEIDTEAELSRRRPRPSSIARGKMPEVPRTQPHDESNPPSPESHITDVIHMEMFPTSIPTYRPLKQDKMIQKLECPPDIIGRLDDLKGCTSFHLAVYGEHLFIVDPVVLQTSTQTLLVNWGFPKHNQAIRDVLWGNTGNDSEPPPITYHTFVRRRIHKGKGLFTLEWSYAGFLRWTERQTVAKWPSYVIDARRNLSKGLLKRWGTQFDEEELSGYIQNGEMQQLCIELSSDAELSNKTMMFVRKKFPKARQGDPSQSASVASI
ncbi:hypothetical protein BDY19DRAFT_944250 [Irpex rosettiformis]|uniref:Uncharacterized protein n=1 Tax=Irpex rosettiformis TaxID=378272 RepID=A0ACB8U4G6_9APHY|nr:hypothetical protein BDY19DRAFT_944250 [Irpex rosettiformis]